MRLYVYVKFTYLYLINLLFYLYFPPLSHPTFVCFFPVGLSLLTQETEVTSTPTRPVENIVLTTKRPTGKKHTNVGWDNDGK